MNASNTTQPKNYKAFVEKEINFLTQQLQLTKGAIQAYQVMLAEINRPDDIDNIAQANKDSAKSIIDEPRTGTVGEEPNNTGAGGVSSTKRSA